MRMSFWNMVVSAVAVVGLYGCSGTLGGDPAVGSAEQDVKTEAAACSASRACGGPLALACRPGEACVVPGANSNGHELGICKSIGGKVCGGVHRITCRAGESCVIPVDNANGHELGRCQPPGTLCGGVLGLTCPAGLRCAFSSSDSADPEAIGTCLNFT